MTSETRIVASGSDQHTKEPVTNFMEGVVPHENPPLTDPLGPLLIQQPSMTYFDDLFLTVYQRDHKFHLLYPQLL
jgi:hypothetical protein